jgi:hypothetical protein
MQTAFTNLRFLPVAFHICAPNGLSVQRPRSFFPSVHETDGDLPLPRGSHQRQLTLLRPPAPPARSPPPPNARNKLKSKPALVIMQSPVDLFQSLASKATAEPTHVARAASVPASVRCAVLSPPPCPDQLLSADTTSSSGTPPHLPGAVLIRTLLGSREYRCRPLPHLLAELHCLRAPWTATRTAW